MDYSLIPEADMQGVGITLPRARRRLLSAGETLTQDVQPKALPSAIERYRQRGMDLYNQATQMSEEEPDMTAIQNYARQRSQQGEGDMLNALAAQFAGERFQPLQGQFLKRAMAARDPIQAGSGFVTPEGQYVADPTKGRDRKIENLMRQAQQYEQMATSAQTAQDRAEAQRAQNEINNQIRLMQLEISRTNSNIAAANAGTASQNRNFKRADDLRAEFTKRSEKVREGTRHAETALSLLSDPTIKNDPTKQVSLVFAFGKMLDPESVVRESEYALIANARGLFESVAQLPQTVATGARLTDSQLKSMQAIAQALYNGSTNRIEDLKQEFVNLSSRRGVDPQDVLPYSSRNRQDQGQQPAANLQAQALEELKRRGLVK